MLQRRTLQSGPLIEQTVVQLAGDGLQLRIQRRQVLDPANAGLLLPTQRRLDLERVAVHAAVRAVGGADGDIVGRVEGGRLGDFENRGRHVVFEKRPGSV